MSNNYKIYFNNSLKISILFLNPFFATIQLAEIQSYTLAQNRKTSAKSAFLTFVTKKITIKTLYDNNLAKSRFLLLIQPN